MRILIVEDEVAVARQIASALTEAGHDPKAVHDGEVADRKSTRLNSSHSQISYAVFCLKKKNVDAFAQKLHISRSQFFICLIGLPFWGKHLAALETVINRYSSCFFENCC